MRWQQCGAILPVEHLRFRILEEVSEFLFDIGSVGENALIINTIALDYTRNLTGVELLSFAQDVLPAHCSRKVEGYIALEFPLLYGSILAAQAHAGSAGQ